MLETQTSPFTFSHWTQLKLLGCIGLLYLGAIFRGKRESYKDLWSMAREGRMVFSATMPRNRFTLLVSSPSL